MSKKFLRGEIKISSYPRAWHIEYHVYMSCIIESGDCSSGGPIIPLLGPANGSLEDKKTTFSVASLLTFLEQSIIYTFVPGPREANLPQLYPSVECQKASAPDTCGIIVLGSWRVCNFMMSILYYISELVSTFI